MVDHIIWFAIGAAVVLVAHAVGDRIRRNGGR